QGAEAEKEQFLDMMEIAYNMDPHREVVLEEEDIHSVHETGVKLHGYPDRVEKLDDGSYLIVDFKTGRSKSHEQDDINTCLQIVIYAYLMEQKGFKVSGGEYRYIRLNETVTCKYNQEMKNALSDKLSEFKRCMEAADFPIPELAISRADDDPDPCVFCKFGTICGKTELTGGSENVCFD
nr:PD-(D/E)XK nuclease family protein [Saccharofermentans sp.]